MLAPVIQALVKVKNSFSFLLKPALITSEIKAISSQNLDKSLYLIVRLKIYTYLLFRAVGEIRTHDILLGRQAQSTTMQLLQNPLL